MHLDNMQTGMPTQAEDADAPEEAPAAAAGAAAALLPAAGPAPALLPPEALGEGALTEALRATFGFPGFRGLQLPVIQSVLRGHSTLAILPTGRAPNNALLLLHHDPV